MENLKIIVPEIIGKISEEIYGHFAEHIGGVFYGGLWVGKDSEIPNERGFRKDALDKLRAINAPVIRWPGGCFAETYNWRDGIGKNRPIRHNWWTPHDSRYENNEVGTHEFFDLCELVGAKAYLAINVTSITPLEAREWLDYCLSPKGSTTLAKLREENGHPEPFKIDFIGVGNENWGGGGNMTADYYALEYRKFATVIDNICKSVSASVKDGELTVTLTNLTSDTKKEISLDILGSDFSPELQDTEILYSDDIHKCNTFDYPDAVFVSKSKSDISKPICLKAASVMTLHIKLKQ